MTSNVWTKSGEYKYSETKRSEKLATRRTSLLLFGNRPRVSCPFLAFQPVAPFRCPILGLGFRVPPFLPLFIRLRCPILLVHDRPSSNATRGKATVGQACGANIGGLRERSSIKIAVWCSWRTSYSPFPRLLLFLSSFPSFPPVFFLPLARPSSLRADRSDRIRSTNQRPVTLLCSFLFRTLPFLLVDK